MSHDTPSLSTLDTFDEAGDAPPAKGNTTAASVSITVTPTPGVMVSGRTIYKKSGVGGTITTSIAVSMGSKNPPVSTTQASSGSKGGRMALVSSEKKVQLPQSTDPKYNHTMTTTLMTRTITTSVTNTTYAASKPLTSTGPVRRLFTSTVPSAGPQSTVVVSATQTVSYPPKVVVPPVAAPHSNNLKTGANLTPLVVTPKPPAMPPQPGGPPPFGKQLAPVSVSRPQDTAPSRQNEISANPAPFGKTIAPPGGNLPYLGAIGSQDNPALSNVIEQPLQQIMKTPTILQEPATQIAKPKKKSTYSDAVGKKLPPTDSNAHPASKMAQLPPGCSQLGSGAAVPPQPPPSHYEAKLNRAPGTKPNANDVGDKVRNVVLSGSWYHIHVDLFEPVDSRFQVF